MSAWFLDGRLVSLIVLLMVVEGLFLLLIHRRTGRGPPPVDLLINLASGMSLLLALLAALLHLAWPWLALALTAALVCHLADLQRRWRAPPSAKQADARDATELP